jgi:hypothetical protein
MNIVTVMAPKMLLSAAIKMKAGRIRVQLSWRPFTICLNQSKLTGSAAALAPVPRLREPMDNQPTACPSSWENVDMAVNIDTTTALRGVHDLQLLVEAVIDADEHDELDWIEWKGTLDLSTKAGCFHVARAVIGMANRLPDRAGLTCEGLGYVVVGAEPCGLQGVASIDPATMDQHLDSYLGGAEGPRYTPTYVSVQGKRTLVIVVEAPKSGDRIFSLRREFDKARSGTVFVRKAGRTVPADAKDLDALQIRLRTGPAMRIITTEITDCPRLFTLTPQLQTAAQRLDLGRRHYRLTLWCELPGYWHPWQPASYSVSQPREWALRIRPYVNPFRLRNSNKVSGSLIIGEPSSQLILAEGQTWRVLRALVFEHDPIHAFGGLRRALSPAGDYLWVCPDHYEKFKSDLPQI